MQRRSFFVPNGQGWELCLKRSHSPQHLVPGRRPVVILPGYGMNSFVFGYHPRGPGFSMIETWVQRGHEVWTADLRGQGESRRRAGRKDYGLAELALDDLGVVFEFVLANSLCGAERVIGVGCSLGGSLLFGHLACRAETRVGALAAMGAPLRWEAAHPLARLASTLPELWRFGAPRGLRRGARIALPLLARLPFLLDSYLHPELVDLSRPQDLAFGVDDLHPGINVEIGEWIRCLDLELRGINVTHAFLRRREPLLCVLSPTDGVVPEAAALCACRRPPVASTEVLRVGQGAERWGHADLFLADAAPERVFLPMARWLEGPGQEPTPAPFD